ncbi:MAG: hypothetical protein M1814_005118 [Vezdaea aestivalis]|nr:MAG: hypothetical protein M1814_005118 [Vezdaea aestivalis]
MFVAHSMGGLVVKQAYVLARQDSACVTLAKRMEAMLFLSTPHRGSSLAHTLNSILRASTPLSTRPYIANLSKQNEFLSLLNESFRHFASDISLYSFYESRATNLYVRSEVIVTKDSAVMGYEHERYAMLDANHRNVCKFESPSNSNYVDILRAICSMTEDILSKRKLEDVEETWRAMVQIDSFLAMPARPDDDLKDLEDTRIENSCEWFAQRDTFQNWLDPDSEDSSMLYWVSANPATGKSVLSGYVINTLIDLNLDCSYYFFHHGDKDASTVSGLLRSLLYQMAIRSAEVRQQLLTMVEKAVRFNKDDAKTIWRKLLWPIISHTSTDSIQYWILDALDECSDFELIFQMIASLEQRHRIRIFLTSRKLPEITRKFMELQKGHVAVATYAEEISQDDTEVDIRLYLKANRYKFHVTDENLRNVFIHQILKKAEGCFLWVRLVLDELALTWSVGEIERILKEVPQAMDPLYSRALKIMSSRSKPNRDLVRAILTWIVCAVRPLTVLELKTALKLDLDADVPELDMAIASLCAQLVHVDKSGRAMIVHLTARTFLTNEELDSEFRVDTKLGHLRLATNCLYFLCSDQMKVSKGRRSKHRRIQSHARSEFARYACLEFAEHLRHMTSRRAEISNKIYGFLEENVLSWIEFVASTGDLSALTRTANSINTYVQRHLKTASPLGELVQLTQNWVIDLHRIVTGFGPNLLTYPSSIYWLIPPFCPRSSAIVFTVASKFERITVKGLKDEGWNDRLSCIDSHDKTVTAVACSDTNFAVGDNTGSIVLYHNSTCLSWKTFEHRSPIRYLLFNPANTFLLSAGRRDVKAWDVDTGIVLWTSEVSHDMMNLSITEDEKRVMTTDRSNMLTSWNMQSGALEQVVDWSDKMPFPEEVGFRRPPITAALSPDSSLIAIVYRGRPICLYDLEDDITHGLVSREVNPGAQGFGKMTSPTSLVFNTMTDNSNLAVAYEDGDLCLFDYEDLLLLKKVEDANAQIVCSSPDGMILLTGNSAGMLQLFEFDTLQLLYRVNAADCSIRALSFSTDNLRFLDVRGTQCNVWEPAVLGLAKQDESSTEQADWQPIIKGMENDDVDITSIQIEDSGKFFFVGRSDGSLSLYDMGSGQQRKVLYRHNHQTSVISTLWGSQKKLVATSDTACRFIVCTLIPDEEFGWKVLNKLIDRRADSKVLQILLDPPNDHLLISTEESNSVWNLATKTIISTQTWQAPPSFSWINSPNEPAHRFLLTPATIETFEWTSASLLRSPHLLQASEGQSKSQPKRVKNAFTFAQGKFLVMELSRPYEEIIASETLLFELNQLDPIKRLLLSTTGFYEVARNIKHLIGGYGSRLLFVDPSRWVCSIDTGQADSSYYVRHFPIPSDWQSQQRRLQMNVSRNGNVLFVRTNEVAVISHEPKSEIYIMEMGNVEKFLTHSLQGFSEPPSVTMIMQSPADESKFRGDQKQIGLTSKGEEVGRSGFGIEFASPPSLRSLNFATKYDLQAAKAAEDSGAIRISARQEVKYEHSREYQALNQTTDLRNFLERDTPIRNLIVAKKNSTILFAQNGIGMIEEVGQKVFTDNKAAYLTAIVNHGLYSESRFSVVHTGFANITLGLSQTSAKAQRLEEAGPGDITQLSARYLIDILTNTPVLAATEYGPFDLFILQLEKLAVNCIINPLTVIVDCRNGELLQNAWAKDMMRALLEEISQVIRSLPELKQQNLLAGDKFSPESLEKVVVDIATKTANNFSSMLQDSRRGRSTEIKYINGYIVQRGQQLGIPCETNKKLIDMVRVKTEN